MRLADKETEQRREYCFKMHEQYQSEYDLRGCQHLQAVSQGERASVSLNFICVTWKSFFVVVTI